MLGNKKKKKKKMLCNHHLYLVPKNVHHPKGKPCAVTPPTPNPTPGNCQSAFYLYGFTYSG